MSIVAHKWQLSANETVRDDIALIKLLANDEGNYIQFTQNVQALCFPTSEVKANTEATHLGWGRTGVDEPSWFLASDI